LPSALLYANFDSFLLVCRYYWYVRNYL